jgi:hypothetical protein
MVVTVGVRYTFLSLEKGVVAESCRWRHRSEGARCAAADGCKFTAEHLENLQRLLSMDTSELFAVEVCQSGSDSDGSSKSGLQRSRNLGKMRSVLSVSSVSTMAPSEESEEDLSPCNGQPAPGTWADSDDEMLWSALPELSAPTPKDGKHCLVPKHVNLADQYARSRQEGQPITTVMIRSIPNKCSQRELIAELESVGLQGCFDFLYIPLDLGTMANVGYAFVNFVHPSHAARCMEVLPKHHFRRQRKVGKGVAVCAAHMQGLEANLRHYEKSAVNTSRLRQRRPVVMNVLNSFSGF